MKLLVQTTGNFGLYDLIGRQEVAAYRPSVVTDTPFITRHKGSRLEVLEVLAKTADDSMLANATDLEAAIKALPRPVKPAAKQKA